MKLIEFNESSLPKMGGGRNTPASVCFGKAGVINFNQKACDLIGIKETSKLSLAQDEENPSDWYFYEDKVNGFPVRPGYGKKGAMINHKKLVVAIASAFGLEEGESHNFKVAPEPTIINKMKYWGIIAPVS